MPYVVWYWLTQEEGIKPFQRELNQLRIEPDITT